MRRTRLNSKAHQTPIPPAHRAAADAYTAIRAGEKLARYNERHRDRKESSTERTLTPSVRPHRPLHFFLPILRIKLTAHEALACHVNFGVLRGSVPVLCTWNDRFHSQRLVCFLVCRRIDRCGKCCSIGVFLRLHAHVVPAHVHIERRLDAYERSLCGLDLADAADGNGHAAPLRHWDNRPILRP